MLPAAAGLNGNAQTVRAPTSSWGEQAHKPRWQRATPTVRATRTSASISRAARVSRRCASSCSSCPASCCCSDRRVFCLGGGVRRGGGVQQLRAAPLTASGSQLAAKQRQCTASRHPVASAAARTCRPSIMKSCRCFSFSSRWMPSSAACAARLVTAMSLFTCAGQSRWRAHRSLGSCPAIGRALAHALTRCGAGTQSCFLAAARQPAHLPCARAKPCARRAPAHCTAPLAAACCPGGPARAGSRPPRPAPAWSPRTRRPAPALLQPPLARAAHCRPWHDREHCKAWARTRVCMPSCLHAGWSHADP